MIRTVASGYRGRKVRLADVEKAVAASKLCLDGIPGGEIFYDHLHPNFEGDYEVAKAILPVAIEVLKRDRGLSPSVAQIASLEDCAKQLGFTAWDRVNTAAAMVKMTSKPPFTGQLDHAQRQGRAEKAVSDVMGRIDQKFVDNGLKFITKGLEKAVAKEKIDEATKDGILGRITGTVDVQGARTPTW